MRKIISINILIILFLISIFESFLGYWFKENSFGIYMRSERNRNEIYKTKIFDNEYKYNYKRNFYGFRGNEFDPKEVKIVFQGGSTGVERFLPEELTIVSILNEKLKSDNKTYYLYNASSDGKTTNTYANDFIYWFPKIKDFNPKVFIFYTGINDSVLRTHPKHYDLKVGEKWNTRLEDYIKNNSFFYERFKKIKNKYFAKTKLAYSLDNKNILENYEFINYLNARKMHNSSINDTDKEFQSIFNKRLENLKNQIIKNKIVPIFITQVRHDGLSDKNLFLINEELKNFAKKNDFFIIKLDEKIKPEKYDFYDDVHTTYQGNLRITEIIYDDLKIILPKILN